jgi:hypothetical protein
VNRKHGWLPKICNRGRLGESFFLTAPFHRTTNLLLKWIALMCKRASGGKPTFLTTNLLLKWICFDV